MKNTDRLKLVAVVAASMGGAMIAGGCSTAQSTRGPVLDSRTTVRVPKNGGNSPVKISVKPSKGIKKATRDIEKATGGIIKFKTKRVRNR